MPSLHSVCNVWLPQWWWDEQLYDLLELGGHSHVISWSSSGRGVLIHDKTRFENELVQLFLGKQSKYRSFLRRLLRWDSAFILFVANNIIEKIGREAFQNSLPETSRSQTDSFVFSLTFSDGDSKDWKTARIKVCFYLYNCFCIKSSRSSDRIFFLVAFCLCVLHQRSLLSWSF